ncbi:MAG TPA: helix-turn-helix transcriptional regulator [Candidatus Acidoferrales bacterium]|nr:helix-turn-helix transcriptional regulator [Candidatus Acidoferrales bacterium]
MIIGDRLRKMREERRLSLEDIEERAGLSHCYLSGVEDGDTVPTIETLENIAWALEVPLYQLFYDGEEPPTLQNLPNRSSAEDIACGGSGRVAGLLPLVSSTAWSHRRARRAYAFRVASENSAKEVGPRSRGNLTPKWVQGTGDEEYNGLNGSTIRQGRSFHRNWAAGAGPMDLHCPHCKSSDLKKVSLAYQEGLYRVDTRTRLSGVLIGSGGPDMVVGRARTIGFRQTELSKVLSPPRKWSYLKLVLWSGIFSLAALVAYVNHVMASPPPVSVFPVKIYALVFAGVLALLLRLFWRHNHFTYRREFARWSGSFVCQRCGNISETIWEGF